MGGSGTISLRLILEIAALGIVSLNIVVMGVLLRILMRMEVWLESHWP